MNTQHTHIPNSQQAAVLEDFQHGAANPLIVHGPQGSGKTELIRYAQAAFGNRVAVLAPTYSSESTLTDRGVKNVGQVCSLDHDSGLNALVDRQITHLIIDEASMIDSRTFDFITGYLTRALNIKVMFIGDPRQLPPVSQLHSVFAPAWFHRITPHHILKAQYRQANNVKPLIINEVESISAYERVIVMTNKQRTQVNIMAHKELYGDLAFLDAEQKILMPKVGQRLISNHTTSNQTYCNNMTKVIEDIEVVDSNFKFKFEGVRTRKVLPQSMFSLDTLCPKDKDGKSQKAKKQDFEFCYAVTCHAAQGAGYDSVLVLVDRKEDFETKAMSYPCGNDVIQQWIYTALGRGINQIHVYDPTNAIAEDNLSLDIYAPLTGPVREVGKAYTKIQTITDFGRAVEEAPVIDEAPVAEPVEQAPEVTEEAVYEDMLALFADEAEEEAPAPQSSFPDVPAAWLPDDLATVLLMDVRRHEAGDNLPAMLRSRLINRGFDPFKIRDALSALKADGFILAEEGCDICLTDKGKWFSGRFKQAA